MPWGTCDDGFYDHDKVVGIPLETRNAACGLYWRAISYCNAKLTDGYLSEAVVASILDGEIDQVEALLAARLWHRRRGGYVIHDFLAGGYNKSRAQVEAERAAKAAAGHLGGLRSGQTRRAKANRTPKSASSESSLRENSGRASESRETAERTAEAADLSTKAPKQTRSRREAGASPSLELRIPSESESFKPPNPRKRGLRSRRRDGENPRANGTSPRQIEAANEAELLTHFRAMAPEFGNGNGRHREPPPEATEPIADRVARWNAAHPDAPLVVPERSTREPDERWFDEPKEAAQ